MRVLAAQMVTSEKQGPTKLKKTVSNIVESIFRSSESRGAIPNSDWKIPNSEVAYKLVSGELGNHIEPENDPGLLQVKHALQVFSYFLGLNWLLKYIY